MARPPQDNDTANVSYEPPSGYHFYPNKSKITGNVPTKPSTESSASATNDFQRSLIPTDSPLPESSSCLNQFAQCAHHPTTAATEAQTPENPNGKRTNQNAARGTHETGSRFMPTTSNGV